MDEKIVIIGAGGHAKDVMALVEDLNLTDQILCFAESDQYHRPREFWGKPVKALSQVASQAHSFILALGDPFLRQRLMSNLSTSYKFISLIHPSVKIRSSVSIGSGTLIFENTILTNSIKIGNHVHLNAQSVVAHDCSLGDFVSLGINVILNGGCDIGHQSYIGSGSRVRDKIKICERVIIGMGSNVVSSIEESGIYVGNPAKKIKPLLHNTTVFN